METEQKRDILAQLENRHEIIKQFLSTLSRN